MCKFYNFVKFLLLLNIKICDAFHSKFLKANDVSFIDFSVDDILNSDLIIITEQLSRFLNHDMEQKSTLKPSYAYVNSTDLNSAVRAMGYHRQMMNEFLLSDYISKEIVGLIPTSANISETIEKRFGRAQNSSFAAKLNVKSDKNSLAANHKLLEDEGSSQYSTWLKRINTFEDIQRQLLNKKKELSGLKRKYPAERRQSLSINIDPTYEKADVDYGYDDLEDGDITGYAFANNPTDQTIPLNLHKANQKSMIEGKSGSVYKQAISKVGYDNGYDDFTASPHHLHNYAPAPPTVHTREIGLKDISDIALTTLAFLSFGMFILQVLMCITMSKDDTSSMTMLPMEGTDTGDIPNGGNTEEIRRKRRSIPYQPMQNIQVIDHLAKRALFSINGVTSFSKDGGTCHHYALCENNKFTRRLKDFKKLWIPAWSLGISWLTMKFNNSNRKSGLRNENEVINSLNAIIVGLDNGNCSAMYINKCKVLHME